MNSNLMAIFGIIASVGLLTMVMAPTIPTMTAFAKGDKCISGQSDDGTFMACTNDKKNPGLSGDTKKECRELGFRCSSSQTGYGEFDNFKIN